MSIKYFYNFCLKDVDSTDLSSDLLSGVRRSYFRDFSRIKDKITSDSETQPMSYDYSIEKEKPMKWLVKDASGATVQEVYLSDNGKYYLYFYEGDALYKRLLFSKLHTLLKTEYFNTATGVVQYTLEPRKSQNGLCILYTRKSSAVPIPLFEEPEVDDDTLRDRLRDGFTDYTVIASTDNGVVRFLSDDQLTAWKELKEKFEKELSEQKEESFVGDDTPLLDKINAKDFNVKRNLFSSLDITRAMAFGMNEESEEAAAEVLSESEEPENVDESAIVDEIVPSKSEADDHAAQPDEEEADQPDAAEETDTDTLTDINEERTEEEPADKPDKLIMADGAVYSYYGDLDAQGNRSGYGRTLTDLGRTAYEGNYFNDKRSGNGSYYYKNGALCYSGDWLENARHGVGVGISSHDGSIHAGNWRNNKPEGNGVRLTAEGDIKFVCKVLSDGTTVLMNYMPDDTVIISKYDENGKKLGDTTVSLKEIL